MFQLQSEMNSRFSVLLLCSLVASCYGHTLHMGRTCPDVQAFPNLSVDKILGTWFVAYQFDTSNTCLVWNLTESATNPEHLVLTESRQLSVLDAIGIDHKHSITADIEVPNPEVPSRMRIRWPTSLTGKADFVVFDTDYENYLAVFQCDRAGLLHRRDATVLARKPTVDDMFVRRIRRLLDNADVSHGSLSQISHKDCKIQSQRNWHIDSDLFGLLPTPEKGNIQELSRGVEDYDISQIEILGDGVEGMAQNFRGSLSRQRDMP